MTECVLVIGNKNYSSWSLRPWLVLKLVGVAFREVILPLGQPATRAEIAARSPSGKVPVLEHDSLTVWDSLAIVEYLEERFPAAGVWPADGAARAWARSISAEMHSGFAALRSAMPMNIRASKPGRGRSATVDADIDRITSLWRECRARFGGDGPFLFGAFSGADAFYAPVVTRFRTYGVALDDVCAAYAEAVTTWPAMAEWAAAAAAEPWSYPASDAA
jgi:glutathione S-transferase